MENYDQQAAAAPDAGQAAAQVDPAVQARQYYEQYVQAFKNQYIEQYKQAGYPYDESQVEQYAVQNAKAYMQQYAPQWCAFLPELAAGAQQAAYAQGYAQGYPTHGGGGGGKRGKGAGTGGAPPTVDQSPGYWMRHMGQELVGQTFQTWWDDEGEWFEAYVRTFNPQTHEHELVYDMDTELETQEFIDLASLKNDDFKLSQQLKQQLKQLAASSGSH